MWHRFALWMPPNKRNAADAKNRHTFCCRKGRVKCSRPLSCPVRRLSMVSLAQKRAAQRIRKRTGRGLGRFPAVVVAFYGLTDSSATKIAVSLIPDDSLKTREIERWWSDDGLDLRTKPETLERIDRLMRGWKAKSLVIPDRIIGCPHEEGVDYAIGEEWPTCDFWKGRDRWTGDNEGG